MLLILTVLACGLRERLVDQPVIEVGPDVVLIPIRKGGKMGFCDRDRRMIIPATYDSVEQFREGFARVLRDNKYAFIDRRGRNITGFKYDHAGHEFSDGLAVVGVDIRTGENDHLGKEIVKKKYGFIDPSGREVIPLTFDGASEFHHGVAAASMNGKSGYIDKEGGTLLPFEYEHTARFTGGFGLIKDKGRTWFVNREMKEAFPLDVDFASIFQDGRALIKIDKK